MPADGKRLPLTAKEIEVYFTPPPPPFGIASVSRRLVLGTISETCLCSFPSFARGGRGAFGDGQLVWAWEGWRCKGHGRESVEGIGGRIPGGSTKEVEDAPQMRLSKSDE